VLCHDYVQKSRGSYPAFPIPLFTLPQHPGISAHILKHLYQRTFFISPTGHCRYSSSSNLSLSTVFNKNLFSLNKITTIIGVITTVSTAPANLFASLVYHASPPQASNCYPSPRIRTQTKTGRDKTHMYLDLLYVYTGPHYTR